MSSSQALQNPAFIEPGYHLEIADTKDTKEILGVVGSVIQEYQLPFEPNGVDKDLNNVTAHYTPPQNRFWVLRHHHQIVGTMALSQYTTQICELSRFYLLPQYRGQGLGKTMMQHFITTAKQLGYHCIILETHTCMKEAVAFYQSLGFRPRKRFSSYTSNYCNQAFELRLIDSEG